MNFLKQVIWYLSRWWGHTWETIKAPQFWIILALLLGLSAVFPYITQKSKRAFYVQSYQYVRAGEYKKGWDEFKKAFGHARISKLFRAGHVMVDALSKTGDRAQPAGNSQVAQGQSLMSPGKFSGDPGDLSGQSSVHDRSGGFPGGILLVLILAGVAAGMVIYIIKASVSYEFEFKWRIKDQEYTGKFECKDEEDLRRHLRTKGGELLEVLKKIKVAFNAEPHFAPLRSEGVKKHSYDASGMKSDTVRHQLHGFDVEPQPSSKKSSWTVHLAWCVIGFYILFVLFWIVLGGVFLLSAH